jgi:hypothetical protein
MVMNRRSKYLTAYAAAGTLPEDVPSEVRRAAVLAALEHAERMDAGRLAANNFDQVVLDQWINALLDELEQ